MRFSPQPRLLLSILTLCIMLTACLPSGMIRNNSVQDNPHSDAADTTAQILWWKKFNDPLLTWLIQETLRANPDLKTAQANLRSARARRKIAEASLLPSLSGSASTTNDDNDNNNDDDSYNANLDAKWEADLFGSNRLSTQAFEADVQVSRALLQSLKIFLAAEVASTYVDLRMTQAVRETYWQNLAFRNNAISLSKQGRQKPALHRLETEQAKLSSGLLRAKIPALDNSIDQLQHALAVLSGVEPHALKSHLAAQQPIPGNTLQLETTVPSNAIQRRPDVVAAEYQVRAASLRLEQAKANLYPRIELGGSFNLNDLSLDISSIARTLLTSISLPLFDGGRLRQNVELRNAEYDRAANNYRKTVLIALQDMANVFSSLQTIRRQHSQLSHNVELARNVATLAQQNYLAGNIGIRNILDANDALLDTQKDLIATRAENTQTIITLYKAIGGAW